MSLPRTTEEFDQARKTEAAARLTENLVSTACPECNTRFAMLARFHAEGWSLRCTLCQFTGHGEPKEATR